MRETPIPDYQLLKRFSLDASEDAFRELVCRHSGMVYSACCRFLGDRHLAEDAAQAVFMVLVRMRLNYGVDKLRKKLAKRGVTLTALALTAFLTTNTAEAAPAALGTSIHAAAINWAGGAARSAGTGAGASMATSSNWG